MRETASLAATHVPLLDRIVRETMTRAPSCVDRNDVATAGLIALTMAADAFDPGHGVPFDQYAATRVRRAIADELLSMSLASRPQVAPEPALEPAESLAHLDAAIGELPELLAMVAEQYFLAGRPMAEIAEALGVTETRVAQLRTEGLVLLAHRHARAAVCA